MIPFRMTPWFRRRMAALVAACALAAWATVTAGYHVQKRREIVSACRADARRVAGEVAEMALQRPVLWRYDGPKIADRLAEGVHRLEAVAIRDARGAEVGLGAATPPARARGMLWGAADAHVAGAVVARVWVGAGTAALWRNSAVLAALSALVVALLAASLYWVPVRTVETAERRIASLTRQLALTLREQERGRIARELHDGAGQAITAARLNLMALRRGREGAVDDKTLRSTAALLDEALEEVRRSTAALMPPALAELGLRGALLRHCESFGQATGLAIQCEIDSEVPPADEQIETACYRIAQEALTNIARHSNAREVIVELRCAGDQLRLTVADDGKGIGALEPAEGAGLQGMRDRVDALGGAVSIGARRPTGTRLDVVLPVRGEEARG
jgi:signal transduction histidine kinase